MTDKNLCRIYMTLHKRIEGIKINNCPVTFNDKGKTFYKDVVQGDILSINMPFFGINQQIEVPKQSICDLYALINNH
jgi:hypothetical protein